MGSPYLKELTEMNHFKLTRLYPKNSHLLASREQTMVVHPTEKSVREPTPRELEVEDLLCRGYSQENIAAIFGRSIHTISIHALSLYKKRGVHTQVGLLLAYLKRKGITVFPDEGGDRTAGRREPLEC
jgi:DNA-binding CsgD family transcriptional regulator